MDITHTLQKAIRVRRTLIKKKRSAVNDMRALQICQRIENRLKVGGSAAAIKQWCRANIEAVKYIIPANWNNIIEQFEQELSGE